MEPPIAISSQGILSCGNTFIDTLATRPPADFCYVPADGTLQGVSPDLVSFSAFGTFRSVRTATLRSTEREASKQPGKAKAYESGDHAALYYKKSGSFFSILVVRCDTWAVQWGVKSFGHGHDIKELHALSAHTIVGHCGASGGGKRVFVANRFDTRLTKKQDNRLWRQFMARPREVELNKLAGDIVSLAPTSSTSFVVLTTVGSLSLVTVNTEVLAEGTDDGILTEKVLLSKAFRGTCPATGTVVLSSSQENDGEETKHAFVVWTKGQESVEVALLSGVLGANGAAKCKTHTITTGSEFRVSHAAFCGLTRLCLLLDGGTSAAAVQFAALDFAGDAVSVSDPVPLAYSPVASTFSAKRLTQTLVCSVDSKRGTVPGVDSLIQTTLPLAHGSYTRSALAKAVWRPLRDPRRHYVPHTAAEKSDASELFRDLQMLGDHGAVAGGASGGGAWIPLELFYCLANKESAGLREKCDVAVFSLKTAPFLHTRLVKQWHNAAGGLKQILQTHEGGGLAVQDPLTLAWHPRHLRRALRLMNQDELAETFRRAVSATQTWAYAEAATSAVDTALHIISLSRQLGVSLDPQGVETIAVLLRASRAMGHELVRSGSRMGLLLESTLQQRRMNRLLKRRTDTTASKAEEERENQARTLSVEKDFFGFPGEYQTARTLQTRYTANTWTQPLRDNVAHHKSVAAQAEAYMRETASLLAASSGQVSDHATTWAERGRRTHGDSILEHFESTLMAASVAK